MNVFFVHTGNAVTPEKFDEQIHLRMPSLYDGQERIFHKKELINAWSQMSSLQAEGVHINYAIIDHKSSPQHFIRSGKRLREQVRFHSADLVHVTWGTFSALLTVLFSPVPVVVSFCGSDILGGYSLSGKKALKSKLSVILSQLAAFLATGIIAKSEKIRKAIWKTNRNKATVIPNGVNLAHFYPADRLSARTYLGWDAHTPVILFFHVNGQVVKNRSLADEVLALVVQQVPGTVMKVVQDVPHKELQHYYNAADVMLLTSFHEGSNNSVKEALACNLPVVSVDCGDTADRLSSVHPSAVVASYNARELATQVAAILTRTQRSNGHAAVAAISEPAIAQRIVQLYKDTLQI
jgi:teichuronic acid biosynthesis glycosyltransferase TuaC